MLQQLDRAGSIAVTDAQRRQLKDDGYFITDPLLDEACLAEALDKFKLVATLEEHSLIGGFGSAVAEWAVDNGYDTRKLIRVGTPDKFFKESGEQEHARERLGLPGHQIADRVLAKLS